MNEIDCNFFKGSYSNSTKAKNNKTSVNQLKMHQFSREKQLKRDQQQTIQQLRAQNHKLKKLLKQTQAKRTQVTKHCSQITRKCEALEQQNINMQKRLKDRREIQDGDNMRYQEIKFLNKQLTSEIEQIRLQNQQLNQKLQYQTDIIQRKYQDLEEKTYKNIEKSLKRMKKAIHYLGSLTPKEIQKTKDIQIENLKRAVEILKGKYAQDNYERQIQELMSPIKNIQEQLHQKSKELYQAKQQNNRLLEEVYKHRKIEKDLIPQYKEAIQKLKKNLKQVREQLSENQYQKCQIKKKYDEKMKECQYKYDQLFREHRKLKLENKIFENKMQEMEADVEEEKQRLMGENQILKKLYKSDGEDRSHHDNKTQGASYKTTKNFRKGDYVMDGEIDFNEFEELNQFNPRQEEHRFLKKNYSASQLRNSSTGKLSLNESRSRLKIGDGKKGKYDYLRHKNQQTKKKLEISDSYQEQNSLESENLRNDIFQVEQDIVNIRKQLSNQLDAYK